MTKFICKIFGHKLDDTNIFFHPDDDIATKTMICKRCGTKFNSCYFSPRSPFIGVQNGPAINSGSSNCIYVGLPPEGSEARKRFDEELKNFRENSAVGWKTPENKSHNSEEMQKIREEFEARKQDIELRRPQWKKQEHEIDETIWRIRQSSQTKAEKIVEMVIKELKMRPPEKEKIDKIVAKVRDLI